MGRGKLTKSEQAQLKKNPFVVDADEKRVIYSNEFKHRFMNEYIKGKRPGQIFSEAGFDVRVLGSKRIERACARWKEAFYSGTLGIYSYGFRENDGENGKSKDSKKASYNTGENLFREVIEDQKRTIRELRDEVERLKKEKAEGEVQ